MNFALYVRQTGDTLSLSIWHLAFGINAIEICLIYIEKMPNKKKLDFDVKRYLVAEVLYPDHVVPLHVGECVYFPLSCNRTNQGRILNF